MLPPLPMPVTSTRRGKRTWEMCSVSNGWRTQIRYVSIDNLVVLGRKMLYISCIDLSKDTNRLKEKDMYNHNLHFDICINGQVVQFFQTFSITCRKISMRKQLKNSSESSRRKPTQVQSVSLETW